MSYFNWILESIISSTNIIKYSIEIVIYKRYTKGKISPKPTFLGVLRFQFGPRYQRISSWKVAYDFDAMASTAFPVMSSLLPSNFFSELSPLDLRQESI